MASARVGSLSQACQCSMGSWLVMMVARPWIQWPLAREAIKDLSSPRPGR